MACQLSNGQSELLQLDVPNAVLSHTQVLTRVIIYKHNMTASTENICCTVIISNEDLHKFHDFTEALMLPGASERNLEWGDNRLWRAQ